MLSEFRTESFFIKAYAAHSPDELEMLSAQSLGIVECQKVLHVWIVNTYLLTNEIFHKTDFSKCVAENSF